MKTIQLPEGYFALVDDEDFPLLDRYNWYIARSSASIYARATIKGVQIYMHNFIMGGLWVDHRDGNGLNNQKENLRFASQRQNSRNRRKRLNSRYKYKGIKLSKVGRYQAQIECNGKQYHLGTFSTQEQAAKAYDAKARELFGEFAYLNFPNSPGD